MNRAASALTRLLVRRIVAQPEPRDALIRFLYYTEEFVERFDIEPVLPHLTEDERTAMLHHFHDEKAHSRALRAYCQTHHLSLERSAAEEALIKRSDEGYAQYLRHLDASTNRFTPAEMYAYYSHVNIQEDLASSLYKVVADELERIDEHPKLVKLLRAFARSEEKHQDSADELMSGYEQRIGSARARLIRMRTQWLSTTTGLVFLRDFLRLLKSEHRFAAVANPLNRRNVAA